MKKFNETLFRQIMAAILCLAMLLPMCFTGVSATQVETNTVVTQQATQVEAKTASTTEKPLYTVIAGSDFQNDSGDAAGATFVTKLLNVIKKDHTKVDGFLFCGDYSHAFTEAGSQSGYTALVGAVNGVYSGLGDAGVYVQGNHDPYTLTSSGAHDASGYGVYVINEKDYMWASHKINSSVIQTTADNLSEYLDAKISAGYTKPIFVVSHLPLHYSMRTAIDGDGQNANLIFDVLNEAGANGLNIIFLFGHDHSNGWDDYLGGSAIFLERGDSINIAQNSKTEFNVETLNFTYMNAGYVGYYRGVNEGSERDLTMTVFEIYENNVRISRYAEDGLHDLKSVGVRNEYKNETVYNPDTRVYTSPRSVGTKNSGSDAGVTVQAHGISDVKVTVGNSAKPSGYSYYQTYDIHVSGLKTGTVAGVTIPVSGADASKPTFVIDHTRNEIIPVEIVNGNVTFTTDHFSLYTVAQESVTTYSATGILGPFLRRVTDGIVEEGVAYVISDFKKGWTLTADNSGEYIRSNGEKYKGFVLDEKAPSVDAEKWYIKDGYVVRGSADSNEYLLLWYDTTTFSGYHGYATVGAFAEGKTAIVEHKSGDDFDLRSVNSPTGFAANVYCYLNRRGGLDTNKTATIVCYSQNTNNSEWHFDKVVTDEAVTMTVTADRSYVLAGKTASLNSEVTVGTQSKSNYIVEYSSSNPSVAVVSSDGVVTGYKTGKVTITAKLTAVDGAATSTPAVVEIPMSVVTLTKNEIIVTGSGTIGQYLTPVTYDTLKTNTAYLIQSGYSDRAIVTNGRKATKDDQTGLALITDVDYSQVWYYDGTNLLYGSPVANDNYLVFDKNKTVFVGSDVGNEKLTVVKNGINVTTFAIVKSDGKALNRYGGPNYYVAYFYGDKNTGGNAWYFAEIDQADVTLTTIFSKNVMAKGNTMDLPAIVYLNGKVVNSESKYTVTWTSSNTAVATVSEKGKVTAVNAGNATITATLTSVEGYTLDIPAVVEIPLTVATGTVDTSSVTASTVLPDFFGNKEVLTPGTISGPYVITNDSSKRVLTGRVMYSTDEDYSAHKNSQGLALLLDQGFDHLWYYDGTYLRYGSAFGSGNYLVYKNSMVTLGTSSDAQFDLLTKNSNNNAYGIGTSSISGSESSYRYLNQYGGNNFKVVNLYQWKSSSGGLHSGSCWWLNKVYRNQNLTLSVTPNETFLRAGETVTLQPTVWLDGKCLSDYTLEWKSSDTNVVTVNNGALTTKAEGGLAVITATLTAVNGTALPVPISVEVPVQVLRINDSGDSVTMTYNSGAIIEETTDIQEGVPYVISHYNFGRWLTGYTVNAAIVSSDHKEGLGLTPFNDRSHVWYYDGTYLRYGDPDGDNNYLAIYPNSSGNIIRLANIPESGDNYFLLDTLTPDATNVRAYNISASGVSDNQYVHQGFSYLNNNVMGFSASDARSEWIFQEVLSSREYSMTITPSSATVYAGHAVTLDPLVRIDGVDTDAYRIEWTVSDPTIADVYQGVVTGLKNGEVTVRARLTYIDGSLMNEKLYVDIPVKVIGITTAGLSQTTGYVAQRASAGAYTGVDMTIAYMDGKQEIIPVTVGMLSQDDVRISAYNEGTFDDLEVNYGGFTLYNAMDLIVIGRDALDQPAFPEEGSVVVNKSGVGVDFQSSGIAQIELGTMGVPGKKGADLIIMLDVSSSMNNERVLILIDCLNDMVSTLQQNGADGEPVDIRLAVASFNGYYHATTSPYYINANDTTVNNSIRTDADRLANDIYTGSRALNANAFVKVSDMKENPFYCSRYEGATSKQYNIVLGSGTNYDYAFDAIYQLGNAINEANRAANEDRDLIVLFMSDGAPFQYNYFSSSSNLSGAKYWNNWLTGTMTDEMYGENANKSYYNDKGLHWMAEAIKGDPDQSYKVIRKNDKRDTDGDNFIDLPGLGATMYSIGFCLTDDNSIREETMHEVIRNVATTPDHYFDADHQHELRDAFEVITQSLSYAATDAYFLDEMGEQYDIQLKQHTYETYEGTKKVTKTIDPTIEVKAYSVYTNQDAVAGICEKGQIGARKLDAYGREICNVVETVSFNVNGTEAYSSVLDSGNILKDGVICAKNFWYNTTSSAKRITLADGSTFDLPAETFYWNVGTINTTEMTLNYYVYLTESLEGNRVEGVYPTNKHADLHYVDYLGKDQQKDVASPVLPWQQARVGYAFYLVDAKGNPIVNQTTGETGSFEQSVKLTQAVYQDMLLNASESDLPADILASGKLPEGYTLFDGDAEYIVKLNSNGSGYYIIESGKDKQTTYVTGLTTGAITNSTVQPGTQVDTDSFATANTVVWFAVRATVQCVPDTVVIDYGLDVEIDVLANDVLMEGFAELMYVKKVGGISGYQNSGKALWEYLQGLDVTDTSKIATSKITSGLYGKLSVSGQKVVYKPATADDTSVGVSHAMKMDKEDEFAYAVKYTGSVGTQGYYYSSVTVIPATTIYFEDNFLTYHVYQYTQGKKTHTDISNQYTSDFGDYQWKTVKKFTSVNQQEDRPGEYSFPEFDANNVYGYDEAYTNMTTYSLGSARKFTAKQEGTKITYGTATFTFTGTGFDVISLTDNISGTITVEVRKHGETTNYRTFLVDNYYGYVYKDNNGDGIKEWVPADSSPQGENPLYQVPVIKASGLEYGTYDVIITISYSDFFDHNHQNWYDFYLDAIRIYDPANDGANNKTIEDAYVADKEGWPEYFELRNLIINRNDLDYTTGNVTASGIVFIDNVGTTNEYDVATYTNYGPNNELYLAPGQSVTFDLNAVGDVASVQLSLKTVGGSAKVSCYDFADLSKTNVLPSEIASATDLYYDITALNGKTVVIRNTGAASNAILSITNVKITYNSQHTDSLQQSYFSISGEKLNHILDSLNKTEDGSDVGNVGGVTSDFFNVTNASLSLDDEVRVNFYFTTTETLMSQAQEIGLLVCNSKASADAMRKSSTPIESADYVVKDYIYDADYVNPTTGEKGRYMVQTHSIPAKNMGDDLYAVLYARFKTGRIIITGYIKYSPKTYAYNRLANSNDPKMKALCVALLNYGAAAQTYFNYKTDDLMNADLTADQKSLVTAYDASLLTGANSTVSNSKVSANLKATSSGFGTKGASVSFEGAFAINYYFKPNKTVKGDMTLYYWSAQDFANADTLTVDNATGTTTLIKQDNGMYWAQISGIAAKDIDEPYYVAAVYSDGTATYRTGIIAYSVSQYCVSKASSTTANLVNFAKATAMYGYHAKQYFG